MVMAAVKSRMTHKITIETKPSDKDGDESDLVYRWACSCDPSKHGPWKRKEWHAKSGGKTHVRKAT